jgi:hypothetical protein
MGRIGTQEERGKGAACQQGLSLTLTACPGHLQTHLPQRLTQLAQDALLIEHFALVAMLVVIMDSLPGVRWQLVEGHVLLHLLILRTGSRERMSPPAGPSW